MPVRIPPTQAGEPALIEGIMAVNPRLSEEDRLQKSIVDHWRTRGVPNSILAAIPNGGARSMTTAARMKATGVLAGVPDLLCIARGRTFFLELKRPGGRLSGVQKARIAQIEDAGGEVFVMSDLDEILELLEARGLLKPCAARVRGVAV